jgi:hypothetical protein
VNNFGRNFLASKIVFAINGFDCPAFAIGLTKSVCKPSIGLSMAPNESAAFIIPEVLGMLFACAGAMF